MATALPILALLGGWGAPTASAQHAHGEGSGYRILFDGPEDGTAAAGNPSHYTVLALGDDDVQDAHKDMAIRARMGDTIVYETTPASGHDYDGVHSFTVMWPRTGDYAVEVLSGAPVASLTGKVVQPSGWLAVTVASDFAQREGAMLELVADVTANAPEGNGTGRPALGAAVLWEVTRDGQLQATHRTGVVEGSSSLVLFAPEEVSVRATAYPQLPADDGSLPLAGSVELTFGAPPADAAALLGMTAPFVPEARANRVVDSGPGPLRLVASVDPWTVVGPGTVQHMAVVALVADGTPAHGARFDAALVGPGGLRRPVAVDSLEADAVLELSTREAMTGTYRLEVEAHLGDREASVEIGYQVQPPSMAGLPVSFDLVSDPSGLAGEPFELVLSARDMAGLPFAHGEVELEIVPQVVPLEATPTPHSGWPGPILRAKLHTHDDGDFRVTTSLPWPGRYDVRVSPFALEPTMRTFDGPLTFEAEAGGDMPALPVANGAEGASPQQMPGLGGAVALALVAVAGLLRRR